MDRLQRQLASEFEMKDLGELKYFLGIEVTRGREGIYLCQRTYVLDLLTETDADWAGNITNRRSTSGYFTFVGGDLVTWKSKKQKVVARSSAKAEYRGMAH
ncbi:secreted RxLR effector protein 161-like [Rosa rugosa]|uniref:secreted RxLR effector protein 161-like n=1 Tax=Rosa rugosa TaxID=74645 RepID=UPI002B402910|nr:secreted RxLR effector protein 161-like [Rosa rugosa]